MLWSCVAIVTFINIRGFSGIYCMLGPVLNLYLLCAGRVDWLFDVTVPPSCITSENCVTFGAF